MSRDKKTVKYSYLDSFPTVNMARFLPPCLDKPDNRLSFANYQKEYDQYAG